MTYTYDKGGNITQKTEYAFTTGTPGTATDTITYTYDSVWKDRLASYDGTDIEYDEIGNPWEYTHDRYLMWQGRELRYFDTDDGYVEYRYNQDGLRCQKVFEEIGTGLEDRYDYYWTDDCRLQGYTVTAAGSTEPYSVLVLYNSAHEAIGFTVGEDTYYYIKNIQGDVLTVTDDAGTPIINYTYDAWGAMTITPASQNVNSQTVAEVAFLNPVTYRGYFYDAELGLYYLQSRYYDPETGRFVSVDAYADTGTGILGTNAFIYCNNNAIIYIDPDGFSSIKPNFLIGYQNEPDMLSDIKDQFYYNPNAYITSRDLRMWILSGVAAATMRPFYRNGIKFYRHFRSGKGKTLYYNYQEVLNSDERISNDVAGVYVDMLYFIEEKFSQGSLKSNQYVCLSEYFSVYPSSKDWQYALGIHRVWMRAKFKYIAASNKMQIEVYIVAKDRYNFDKGLSGVIGILSSWNGRFVEVGLAKHFTSVGTLNETFQWERGTYV